jgi:thiol-disulfide isomerase/thioredoxin
VARDDSEQGTFWTWLRRGGGRGALPALLAIALGACGRGEETGVGAEPAAATGAPAKGAAARPAARNAGESWNDAQIDWQPYEQGMERAKAEGKPVCVVIYTDWCPHCKNYSHVFEDPRVVERARDFVMIRANGDKEADVAQRYAPDGGYVPRTLFLAPDGTLQADVHAPRPKFIHFYDEHDPASLLGGMQAALAKLGR